MAASTTPRRRAAPKTTPAPRPAPVVIDEEGNEVDDGLVVFTVTFDRDGTDEKHTFTARPRLGYKQMRGSALARKTRDGLESVLLERMIRPSLLDDDGVPAKWEPNPRRGEFVDPDGNTRPVDELPDLLELAAGSSRRRWVALMDDDDELQVDAEEITAVYEQLVEAAAERPSRRR